MPYFSLFDLRSLAPDVYSDRRQLDVLFRTVFARFHAERRFTFIYSTRQRTTQTMKLRETGDLSPIGGLPVFARYLFSVDAILPPGTAAFYDYQQSLVNPQLHDRTYWIKRGTLKMKYILDYLESQEAGGGATDAS